MFLTSFIILIVSFLSACVFSFSEGRVCVCVCVCALCIPTMRRCGKSPIQSSSPDPFQAGTKMCSPVKHWAQSARVFFLVCKGLCVCVCVCSWFDLLSSVPRTVVRMVSIFFL